MWDMKSTTMQKKDREDRETNPQYKTEKELFLHV